MNKAVQRAKGRSTRIPAYLKKDLARVKKSGVRIVRRGPWQANSMERTIYMPRKVKEGSRTRQEVLSTLRHEFGHTATDLSFQQATRREQRRRKVGSTYARETEAWRKAIQQTPGHRVSIPAMDRALGSYAREGGGWTPYGYVPLVSDAVHAHTVKALSRYGRMLRHLSAKQLAQRQAAGQSSARKRRSQKRSRT